MSSGIRILLLLCAACLAAACSDDAVSPEAQIRAFVEAAADAAERRDVSELDAMVHAAYLDQKGYNKQQLAGLLRGYFFRHKNIHLFTRVDAGIDALATLRAQIYRFELDLVRQDGWQLRHARWEPASLADLN